MKHLRLLLLPVLVSPALLSLGTTETRIEFKPSQGTVVQRTFMTRAEMTLDSMDMKMNGQSPPMMPEMNMTITTEVKTVVEDEFLAIRDGRVQRLKRHFSDLSQRTEMAMEMDMMGQTQTQDASTPASSELEGQTVHFTWSDADEAFRVHWPEGREGKPELLTGLSEDMDLRAFLPKGPVAQGQRWTIEPAAMMSVMAPGGDLKLVPEDVDTTEMAMMGPQGTLSDWFGESLTGTVSGVFEGMREEDGRQLAAIRIQYAVKNSVDMSLIMEAAMENLPSEAGEMEFDHMDMEIQYEGEGMLLWDVARGIAHSFDASGDFGMLMDMGMSIDAGGMSMSLQMTMEMSGSLAQTARFE
jgi:hypothetical protein